MNLLKLLPKFIRVPLILREYKMTKAVIQYIKTDRLVHFKSNIENYSEHHQIKPIEFYQNWLAFYELQLLQKESRLEDIRSEMRRLNLRYE